MNKIYTLIGIPGSGKSTIAKKYLSHCEIISTDEIRKELFGSAEIQDKGWLVFQTAYSRVANTLEKGKDVVFDATNLTKKDRKKILKFEAIHIAIVMLTPIDICKQRNASRERKVPEEVIDRMSNKFTIPDALEGFTYIYFADENVK